MLSTPEVQFAVRDGVHIAFQVAGTGPTDLVVVAGAASVSLAWEDDLIAKTLRRLANFSHLVTYDQRGVGLSDRIDPDSTPTMDDCVSDLEAVIEAAGVENPVLFGFHNGGAVAALYAIRHPVRRLVLCNTWARIAWAEDYEFGFPERLLDRLAQRYETEWGEGRLISEFSDRGGRAAARHAELQSTSLNQHGALFRLNRSYDIRGDLGRVAVPTLVLHMEDDVWVPPVFGQYIADSIPGARLVLLPGSDHVPLRNHGDAVVDEIERFVTGGLSRFSDRMRTAMLFTDIVASTELAARVGDDAWSGIIDEHNRRVLRLVEACGGEQLKHTGDGVLVAFDRPDAAIRCATRCMAAVAELGVDLRAGVHVGEVARMGNRDLAGLEVHFAQRLCARAQSDEVLVSAAVRDACAGTDIRFEQRGKSELKGIPGVWEVFAAQV